MPAAESLPVFECPADKFIRITANAKRSYSMSRTGAQKAAANYPPNPGSASGLGLFFNPVGATEVVSPVRLSILPAPANTILIHERVTTSNFQGGSNTSVTDNPNQVVNDPTTGLPYYNPNFFHNNKFNWLLSDGHADILPLAKTIRDGTPLTTPSRMWTITAADD